MYSGSFNHRAVGRYFTDLRLQHLLERRLTVTGSASSYFLFKLNFHKANTSSNTCLRKKIDFAWVCSSSAFGTEESHFIAYAPKSDRTKGKHSIKPLWVPTAGKGSPSPLPHLVSLPSSATWVLWCHLSWILQHVTCTMLSRQRVLSARGELEVCH